MGWIQDSNIVYLISSRAVSPGQAEVSGPWQPEQPQLAWLAFIGHTVSTQCANDTLFGWIFFCRSSYVKISSPR